MPRFTDEWVINKLLFEYTTNFSCLCCVPIPNNFLPDGVSGLITSISDLESDVAHIEIHDDSLFPPELKEAIWGDRLRVRYHMKKDIATYSAFYNETLNCDVSKLVQFCIGLGPEQLAGIFQITKEQVKEIIRKKYKISPSYCSIISAVLEQVANYDMTNYEMDSRCPEEELFESILRYNEKNQFVIKIVKRNDENDFQSQIDDIVLDKFVTAVCKWLIGPKLLQKGPSLEGNIDIKRACKKHGLRFRGDRRLVRLVIARYWTDCIIEKYKEMNK